MWAAMRQIEGERERERERERKTEREKKKRVGGTVKERKRNTIIGKNDLCTERVLDCTTQFKTLC